VGARLEVLEERHPPASETLLTIVGKSPQVYIVLAVLLLGRSDLSPTGAGYRNVAGTLANRFEIKDKVVPRNRPPLGGSESLVVARIRLSDPNSTHSVLSSERVQC
jgi:hypothetical protein